MGQFGHLASYPDASFHDVTAPNANTLYSAAWLDLKKEPYVLSLPNTHDRYYLMPMLSGWTEVIASPGTRTTGTGPQRYAITGPDYPNDITSTYGKQIKSPTNLVWIIGRTFAQDTPTDLAAVHALQRQYTLVPLSFFGKPFTPPAGTVNPSIDMKTPVRNQVDAMDAQTFFTRLAMLLKDNPPSSDDSVIVAQMASIGIVPGQTFDQAKAPGLAPMLADLPKLAQQRILAFGKTVPVVNGWSYMTNTGTYGTDYDRRAFVAMVGLGANLPEDAIYPSAKVDASGQPLTGANKYVLHFAKGQQPPVHAFWSLTMYGPDLFFVENPINRYQISPQQSPVTFNADSSLDLYIQHESPGAARQKNWLPAPNGPFVLTLRFYQPKDEIINGTWKPPGVMRTGVKISKEP
jgi:DNA sulfur modification protein DndE